MDGVSKLQTNRHRDLDVYLTPRRCRSGAGHPAGGGKADFCSVHVGLKGGADHFDDLRASPVVCFLQDQADRTEPGHITDQLLLGENARDIDRPDIDLGPAAVFQNAADSGCVGEGELPGCVRPAGGRFGSRGAAARSAVVMNGFSAALRQAMNRNSAS